LTPRLGNGKPGCVNSGTCFVNSSPLQFALREMKLSFSNPRALGVLLVVVVVLGLTGPFGTYAQLPLAARLGYWAVIALATYGIGLFFAMLALGFARPIITSRPLLILVLAAIASMPVTLAVALINILILGENVPGPAAFGSLLLSCFVITLGVSVLTVLSDTAPRGDREAGSEPQASTGPAPPAILKRLALPQRGALRYMSMQDHYVEVVTDKGHALILMRLSDAIAETAPVAGLQIHRSHWVALDAVRTVVRLDGKILLEMADGVRLPVSRSYQTAAREAGLLV